MTCLQAAVDNAANALKIVLPHTNASLEAELLLCQVLGCNRSYIMAWPERPLTTGQEQTWQNLVNRRLRGEPIAYILGQRSFWTLELLVNQAVLIPRPETELLVELALIVGDAKLQASGEPTLTVVDLGTGSGAVAAAIAKERPHWLVYATDISAAALDVARHNFHCLGLSIPTYSGFWCAALPTNLQVDLLVSNPPYVADTDPHLTRGDLPWEPRHALAAGNDGLDALRVLCAVDTTKYLKSNGSILLEHGYNQGLAVRSMLQQQPHLTAVQTWCDLAGHERVTGAIHERL